MVITNSKRVLCEGSQNPDASDRSERTHKYLPAVSCKPTKKYTMIVKRMSVKAVIGMSTSVSASDSTKGWYIAALECRWTIGRWTKSAGISAMDDSAANKRALKYAHQYACYAATGKRGTHKKMTPPLEKNVAVLLSSRKKIVPTIIPWKM